MRKKEKKDSKSTKDYKSTSERVAAPIVTQFDRNRGEQFKVKSNDPTTNSNDPFIKGILEITRKLPKSRPKP